MPSREARVHQVGDATEHAVDALAALVEHAAARPS
jgi:hypothetical protein